MITPEIRHLISLKWPMILRIVLVWALLIGLAQFPLRSTAAPAFNTWYVATTGNDAKDCSSPANACRTINSTINRASNGDTINIAAGVYLENVSLPKSLSLVGAGQAVTIIDGGSIGPVVLITSETAGTTANLSELTLQNGDYGLGGGLHSESGIGLVTVSNSRIIDNVAFTGGGGIFSQGNLKLINVLIENNVNSGTQRGGGLFNLGTATLTGVIITNNTSNVGGGVGNSGALILTDSTIENNLADEGGGVYNVGVGAQFISSNNTFVGNHATSAGGAIYNATSAIDTGSLITGSLAATGGGGIYNHSTGQLTLKGTALRQNQAANTHGGGLYNDGSATLTSVIVRGNTAANGVGGGLYHAGTNGTLSMIDTVVSDNRAVNGGGLYAASLYGVLSVINSQITNNQSDLSGGGLYNSMTANLTLVAVSNNRAVSGKGGGIFNAGTNSRLSLTTVTLDNNQALGGDGGGLYNESIASASGSTLAHNQAANGGGLYNNLGGRLSADNSTWYLNSATQGGGINNRGTLTLTQSNLYSNTTTLQGGSGLYNNGNAQGTNVTLSYNTVLSATTGAILNDNGTLDLVNSTISQNRWPALARTGGIIALANSIVAASIGGVNCSGALTSNGHNLDSGVSCGLSATGDISNTDPLLGPLTNNGGPTLTRALEIDSLAIDAGNNATCPPLDQRGITRPQGDTCDIGAYETIGYTNGITETIAPNGCITSTTMISNSYLIGFLHVGANVTFAPRGDLRVKLYSPGNVQVQLLGATGGSGQNLNVLWDDNATQPVGTENQTIALPFYQYVRLPDQSLASMSGRSLRGAWRLEICNYSSVVANTATLNRWSLIVPSINTPKVMLPLIRR